LIQIRGVLCYENIYVIGDGIEFPDPESIDGIDGGLIAVGG